MSINKSINKVLDNSSFRVLFSLLIANTFILFVGLIEQLLKNQNLCQIKESILHCSSSQVLAVIRLDNIEGFSILAAASLYLLESRQRKQEAIYKAWQIIDNAAAAKVLTSYARVQALQDLNNYGISLKGLDATYANLDEINLAKANLSKANFPMSSFMNANLTYVNLSNAILASTNFTGANLSNADLSDAELFNADFTDANLSNANLKNVIFGRRINNGEIQLATLINADLSKAILINAQFLTPELVKSAKNCEKAIYDEKLCAALSLV
ncbi:pentapeptide repeat-containing protein [Nostoc sp. UHCC 0702]|nr:pentapeptide repeat-containing protein [Nostoc sp. UHCC 0702]